MFVLVTRDCLDGGRGPQIGEVTCGWSPNLSYVKRDQIKITGELPHLSRLSLESLNYPHKQAVQNNRNASESCTQPGPLGGEQKHYNKEV